VSLAASASDEDKIPCHENSRVGEDWQIAFGFPDEDLETTSIRREAHHSSSSERLDFGFERRPRRAEARSRLIMRSCHSCARSDALAILAESKSIKRKGELAAE
jgi:hypothetical protein